MKSGYTLTGVIIFLVLVMLLWEGTLSQIGSYLRTEKAFRIRQTENDGFAHALAWAITLLETGLPPESNYSCLMPSPTDSNDIFVATFINTAGIHYSIDVRPANQLDMWLDEAPETFEEQQTKPGKPEKPDKPGKPKKPNKPPKPDKPGKPKKPDNPGQAKKGK
jgi:hypothetical protein